jgi:anti-sigma factor RsiW
MRCAKLIGRIESYLGGTLTPREKAAFDKHLSGCEACRKELDRCIAENKLYRQALEGQRLQGSVRSTVLSRLKHAYTAVRQHVEAQPKKVLWIAPLAAVAQFLIAFWLSGMLFLGSVPDRVGAFHVPEREIVSIEWVREFNPHRYFLSSKGHVRPVPGIADHHVKVD